MNVHLLRYRLELESKLRRKIERDTPSKSIRFSKWCCRNKYFYKRGKWRKMGDATPFSDSDIWKLYLNSQKST